MKKIDKDTSSVAHRRLRIWEAVSHPVTRTVSSTRGCARVSLFPFSPHTRTGAQIPPPLPLNSYTNPPGMVHAGVGQKVLNCNVFKTLFSARIGHARGTSHARGLHGLTFPGPRPHADDPRPCGRGLRCMGRLFGSTVKRAPNIRIRWRPPSAHQAAAAAGRAIGAPHRYHRSAPSQC